MARILAWSVHLLTATGAIVGLLALDAVARGDGRTALAMMTLAMAIDSFDGMLARAVDVDRRVPEIDGALLDNLIDYLNYAVVPAWLIWRLGVVPGVAGGVVAGSILLAAAYQFAHRDAKTDDHFFRGFPSFWNVAAFYLLLLRWSPAVSASILVALVVASFVPMRYAYPSRMLRYRGLTLVLTGLWGASVVAILVQYPRPAPELLAASLSYLVFYAAISLWAGRRAVAQDSASRSGATPAGS